MFLGCVLRLSLLARKFGMRDLEESVECRQEIRWLVSLSHVENTVLYHIQQHKKLIITSLGLEEIICGDHSRCLLLELVSSIPAQP